MGRFRCCSGTWGWCPTWRPCGTGPRRRSAGWPTATFALGWRGSGRQWHRYERAYLLLAALATPLVLSVHSVVSFDFAVSQVPGWHTTIFPPYFVAGAIFSGFAMVVSLMVPARAFFGLKDLVTIRHLDNMNKIILATSCMVGYAYGVECFTAWYSGSPYEMFALLNRALGPYAWAYWTMVACNVLVPHLFWFRKCRTTPWMMVVICVLVNVGMWMERFVIVITSLSRDYLPSSWRMYVPTWVDLLMLLGSFGLFFTLFLLFCRYLPMVAMAEVKLVLPRREKARPAPRSRASTSRSWPASQRERRYIGKMSSCRVGQGRLGGRRPTIGPPQWWACASLRELVPPYPPAEKCRRPACRECRRDAAPQGRR